jgi:hypothetical protein
MRTHTDLLLRATLPDVGGAGDSGSPRAAVVASFEDVEDRDDVPVAKGRSAPGLSPEALDELLILSVAVLQQLGATSRSRTRS